MSVQKTPVVRMRAFSVGHNDSQQVRVSILPIPRTRAGCDPDRASVGMAAGIGFQLLRVIQDA
jgi:hypothetical protein